MTVKRERIVPEPILALQVRVEQWRKNRSKQHRMPPNLWEAAATLAKQYGVHLVSSYLSLGYASLKKKAAGDWGPVKSQSVVAGFVDLKSSSVIGPSLVSSNNIELHRPDGHRVVIRNADSEGVFQVANAFFGQSR